MKAREFFYIKEIRNPKGFSKTIYRKVMPIDWEKVWSQLTDWDKIQYPSPTFLAVEYKNQIQELIEKQLRGEL